MRAPRELLADRTEILGPYLDRLRNGDPTIGWPGAKNLSLAFHRLGWWEVWIEEPAQTSSGHWEMIPRMIARQKSQEQPLNDENFTRLLIGLRDRDTWKKGNSHSAQIDKIIEKNERLEARRRAEAHDALMEPAMRTYYAAAKDLGEV